MDPTAANAGSVSVASYFSTISFELSALERKESLGCLILQFSDEGDDGLFVGGSAVC